MIEVKGDELRMVFKNGMEVVFHYRFEEGLSQEDSYFSSIMEVNGPNGYSTTYQNLTAEEFIDILTKVRRK